MSTDRPLMPGGESTSARLREVEAERDRLHEGLAAERQRLREVKHDRDHVAQERDQAERDRDHLSQLIRSKYAEIEKLQADLAAARIEIDHLRAARSWVVARDGGRFCERCEGEVERGHAYEVEPGTGGLVEHIHCPTKESCHGAAQADTDGRTATVQGQVTP